MKIIDAHCHVASIDHVPQSFIDGALRNIEAQFTARGIRASRQRLLDTYLAQMQDPLCDVLVDQMDEAGIARSIILAPDFTYSLKDCSLTIEETFLACREILGRHHGRLEVFGGMDPRWGNDGLDLFERSLNEFGFRGFKVYPPCGFSPSAIELFPFYEVCAQHQVPVVVHIGPTSPVFGFGTSSPFLIDEAARQFPTVNFILAHGSVSFTEECVMLCKFRPNIYLDISAFQSMQGTDSPGEAVRRTVSQGINHKVIFGTDWPVFRLQGDQAGFVQTVVADDGPMSDLSYEERSLILYRNIERLLEGAREVETFEPVAAGLHETIAG
jgi:predicted TIM-barrel fold metal-dependent hydrolase